STNGRWYLVGWCQLREAMRWFTVSRIEQARVTKTVCSGHTVHEVGEPPESARPVHGRGDLPESSAAVGLSARASQSVYSKYDNDHDQGAARAARQAEGAGAGRASNARRAPGAPCRERGA